MPGKESDDHVFTLVDDMVDTNRNGVINGTCEELLVVDEEGEGSVASVEEQLLKEMTVYEVCIALDAQNDMDLDADCFQDSSHTQVFCCWTGTFFKHDMLINDTGHI